MTRNTPRDDTDPGTDESENHEETTRQEQRTGRLSRRSVLRAAGVTGVAAVTGVSAITLASEPALAADISIQTPGELAAGDTLQLEAFTISYSDLDTSNDITVTYRITETAAETSAVYGITSDSGDVTTEPETLTVPDVSEEVTGATIEILLSHGETSTTVTSNSFTVVPKPSAPDDLQSVHDGMSTNADGAYIITNVHELQAVNHDTSANYVLGNDIDASETDSWNGGNGFNPIGDSSNAFTGEFDGNGFEITGLTINRGDEGRVGLFSTASGFTVIKNVGLVDNTITGGDRVGGLVGNQAGGTVSGSYVTGSVNGNSFVGGLVGVIQGGDVSNSYATGSVTGNIHVSGLVGQNYGSVSDSYWDTETTGQSSSSGGGTGLTTSEMQGEAAASNMTGFDFDTTWKTVAGDYPELRN